MLIDRSHKRWCLVTGVLFLMSGALYWFYAQGAAGGPRGGSPPGLAFGAAGSALMVFAGLIALRKRVPEWRIGSAQFWLRGHIWLGLLSVPLILFHAGFRWGGLLEQLLLAVLAGVVASGAFGLVLQQVLPRQMTTRVPLETFHAQIPHVCDVLQVEGDVLVARLCGSLAVTANLEVATDERLKRLGVNDRRPLSVVYAVSPDAVATSVPVPPKRQGVIHEAWKAFCPELKRFYLADVRPFLSRDFLRGDPLADEASADGRFALQRVRLPSELHEALDELAALCEERRQLAAQARIHRWLHGWLFLHVPLSMALLGLGAVHAVLALYY
ncbi:MAG TPA: hypothetical protein VMV69_04050 [Pirellulales bacterium]|nr:hypothetical protein [Pirellulales bacterium]